MKSGWKDFYPDVEEPVSPNAPEAWGNVTHLHRFVNTDSNRDNKTRISNTAISILLNQAPIMWYYNQEIMIDT